MKFPEKLQRAKEAAKGMLNFKGKTVWNQVLKDSGMFEDDYMIQACDPVFINELIERYEALEKKLREVPWTDKDTDAASLMFLENEFPNFDVESFYQGIVWAEERIKEREL